MIVGRKIMRTKAMRMEKNKGNEEKGEGKRRGKGSRTGHEK